MKLAENDLSASGLEPCCACAQVILKTIALPRSGLAQTYETWNVIEGRIVERDDM